MAREREREGGLGREGERDRERGAERARENNEMSRQIGSVRMFQGLARCHLLLLSGHMVQNGSAMFRGSTRERNAANFARKCMAADPK